MALHTLQDYFAHVITAKLKVKETYYGWNESRVTNGKYETYRMFQIDNELKLPNSAIEDNPDVFRWRYNASKCLTLIIYNNFWTKYRDISNIKSVKQKTYSLYKGEINAYYWGRKWGTERNYTIKCYIRYCTIT